MLNFLIVYTSFLLCAPMYALPVGVEHEFERFVEQVAQSTPLVENALSRFKTNYSPSLATHTSTTYPADDIDVASASSPIQKITYGYVSYDDASTNYQNFVTAGADNAGMYVLEVHFKSATDKIDISPLLENKSLLFIAYGSGSGNPIIYRNSDTGYLGGGSSNLSSMTSIAGFTCINKTQRCTAAAGSHPNKSCDGQLSDIAHQSTRAGFFSNPQGTDINIFYYVTGDFSLCATLQSARNCMYSGSC